MKKNKLLIVLPFLLLFVLTSCASTKSAVITKCPERFFWKIEGRDTSGKKSAVYIQGTIHVGDERILPLPEAVENAFDTADRYVAELSSSDIAEAPSKTMERMVASYNEDYDIRKKLSISNLDIMYKLMPEEQVAEVSKFEPWVLNSMISSVWTNESKLSTDYGLDMYFYKKVEEKGKKVEGLDSLKTQMELLDYGDYDTQLAALETQLSDYPFEKSIKNLQDMYAAYLDGDTESLYAVMFEEKSAENSDADFNQKLFDERNERWAKKINEYLKRGGTTFLFAGAGHFVGLNSVFEYLRQNQ